MKIDWNEFERGVKEANWLTEVYQKTKDGIGATLGGAVSNVTGLGGGALTGLGNTFKELGGVAMAGLPVLMAMGKGKRPAGSPQINIDLAKPKTMLGFAPGEVRSLSSPKLAEKTEELSKTANLLDPSVLRTVVLSRVANDIMTESKKNQELSARGEPEALELVSRYPEMQKILAEPTAKEYLKTLLTKTSHKHTNEKSIYT
jgi:hypothetical protein